MQLQTVGLIELRALEADPDIVMTKKPENLSHVAGEDRVGIDIESGLKGSLTNVSGFAGKPRNMRAEDKMIRPGLAVPFAVRHDGDGDGRAGTSQRSDRPSRFVPEGLPEGDVEDAAMRYGLFDFLHILSAIHGLACCS